MSDLNQTYAILAKHIKTAEGRARIAATMTQPLRVRRDYASVARKAFYVEQLPDGANPYYDKDVNVTAYKVSEDGQNIISVQKPARVQAELFTIAANPEISIEEVQRKRFDALQRIVDQGRAQIGAEEDRKTFAVIDAVASDPTTPNPTINVTGNLTSNVLADAWGNVETNDIRVANVFMNARDYADLRKFDRDVLDPITQESLLKSGILASLWGAKIITSRVVPVGTVYVLGEPEFAGRIPVARDLTVLSADDNKARMIGFSMFETLGVVAYNPLAIQKIVITRV